MNIASLFKSSIYLSEKPNSPESWQGCLHINHLSYSRFLTLVYGMVTTLLLDDVTLSENKLTEIPSWSKSKTREKDTVERIL